MDKPEMNIAAQTFYMRKFEHASVTECAADVTMPDYYPEVRRVVAAFAQALPDSKFISDGKLEYGGTVSFSVLYIGDDDSLCCVPYSGEYSDSVVIPAETDGAASVRITSKSENVQCRVTAPRKLSLKARVRTQISSDGREYYTCPVKTASGEKYTGGGLEYLDRTEKTVCRKWATATGNCSGEMPDVAGTKPVMCTGQINILSALPGRDCVSVRGCAEIKCVVFTADGVYTTVCGSLPFEETVNLEGVSEGDIAAACGRAASVTVNAEAGGSAEVEYDLDVTVCRTGTVCVTEDIYSTRSHLEPVRCEAEPINLIACSNGNLTVNGDIRRTSRDEGSLVTCTAEPVMEKAEMSDGKLSLSGNCRVKVYIASNGDVICEEGTLPVKYEIPAPEDAAGGEILWNCDASPIRVSAKPAGDRITVTAELCMMTDAVCRHRITPVTEARLTGENFYEGNGYTLKICRPEKGTPVWETAKKYHASIPELERINGIHRDGVSDGSPIIIKQQ